MIVKLNVNSLNSNDKKKTIAIIYTGISKFRQMSRKTVAFLEHSL